MHIAPGHRESTTSSTAAAGGAGKESMPGTTTPLTSKRAFILNDCIVSMPARLLDCMCFISKRAYYRRGEMKVVKHLKRLYPG